MNKDPIGILQRVLIHAERLLVRTQDWFVLLGPVRRHKWRTSLLHTNLGNALPVAGRFQLPGPIAAKLTNPPKKTVRPYFSYGLFCQLFLFFRRHLLHLLQGRDDHHD